MHGLSEKVRRKGLLACRLCSKLFSAEEVLAGKFEPETGICLGCYQKLQEEVGTCFGKRTVGKRLGYEEGTIECREFCPDKTVCKQLVGHGTV